MKNNIKIFLSFSLLCWLMLSSLLVSAQLPHFPIPKSSPSSDDLAKIKADSINAALARLRAKIKPYASVVTKDFVTMKGLFTIHKNKTTDQWYFEIPDTLLYRDIMAITRLTKTPGGSGIFPGEQQDGRAIRFEMGPDSILDMRNDLQVLHADSSSQIYKAVTNSDVNPILASFPILAYGPGHKSYVIDATRFIDGSPMSFMNAIGGKSLLSNVITFTKDMRVVYAHAYPLNVEISIRKQGMPALLAKLPTNEDVTFETVTSFVALPKEAMMPRYFDERVGYINDNYTAFTDDQQHSEKKQFINRWRLEPRTEDMENWKSGQLVEPKKQIVIYIDPATPKQWRPYLIKGINDWQKAFEQAGFKNAIIGKEWPENDTTMHMDDARYSMINYFPSEVANAYGPNVHDPRSGEIIQTHIGWYHNVMSLLRNWYMIQAGALDPEARHAKFDEKLMGQLIRFVSSHEVGHTLGLRHNFLSSSFTPVDSLRSQHYLEKHGHTISIMDYARFNYVAQPEDHIKQEQLWPHIGEYDKWAIEWGYGRTNATNSDTEKLELSKLTTKRLNKSPKLQWLDAELIDEGKQDPRAQTEDLGNNAMKASTYGIKNLKRVANGLESWTHTDGGNYADLKSAYGELKNEYYRFIKHVLNNIPGVYYTPKSEDQTGTLFTLVPKAKQLEALRFFDKELFTTPSWLMNKQIIERVNLPNDNYVNDMQVKVLNTLLDAGTINMLLAHVFSYGNNALPVDQYLNAIHHSIWKELREGRPVQDECRRNLQRSYVQCLLTILISKDEKSVETEAASLIRSDARQLRFEIKNAIKTIKNKTTLNHLRDLDDRLDVAFGKKNNTGA